MSAAASRPRIKKGPASPRRVPVKATKRVGVLTQLLARIPIRRDLIARIGNWTLALLVLAAIVGGLVLMGLPQMLGTYVGELIGRAGLSVRTIEVVGRQHADRDAVYRIAGSQQARPMPLVDLAGTRAQLLALGWVEDARVSRRLPDTLVVDIVERKPAAVWQYKGVLALIDANGREIAAVDPATLPEKLPLVIGPGANVHAAEFARLVEGQAGLKPQVEGGSWIGDRRWDVRFTSGETLALPEGEKPAADALAYFARRDAAVRLLGQGYARFDMRDASKMVVRVSREPGRRVASPVDAKSI